MRTCTTETGDFSRYPVRRTITDTDLELPRHTDLPTRERQPGFQFLHCLVNDAAVDTEAGERRLRGCYIDRDEILSRIRVLERTLDEPWIA